MSFRFVEVSEIEGKDKLADVSKIITGVIIKALNKCEIQGKLVDWDKLREYVMEFFLCADYRADACILEARKKSRYFN